MWGEKLQGKIHPNNLELRSPFEAQRLETYLHLGGYDTFTNDFTRANGYKVPTQNNLNTIPFVVLTKILAGSLAFEN